MKSAPIASAFFQRFPNFTFSLHITHGFGVRPARYSLVKIIDDQLLELVRLIHDVMRNLQRMRHRARIGDGCGSAALVLRAREAILRPDLHRHADDLVPLLLQEKPPRRSSPRPRSSRARPRGRRVGEAEMVAAVFKERTISKARARVKLQVAVAGPAFKRRCNPAGATRRRAACRWD